MSIGVSVWQTALGLCGKPIRAWLQLGANTDRACNLEIMRYLCRGLPAIVCPSLSQPVASSCSGA
eukprot:8824065-Lingulodinium_polyedra.AAC.1